ncbi:MAG: GNAT family acetyltransferase [Afipia sp. 62-7]|nr:MAG: GNAT family acetyltransferase [Afipia sp. 62-7]
MIISAIADADIPAVVALWERCELTRPWNDPTADIQFARGKENSDVLVGRIGNVIVATAMVGHDGHRGWLYYVATDPDRQKQGFGRTIVTAAENWLRGRGIPKVQLLVRAGNTKVQAFYETLNFEEQERIVYAKWLDGREMTP